MLSVALAIYGLSGLAAAQSCTTSTVTANVPSDNAVALNSYSYCAGTLNVTAYVQNKSYSKVVTLYYSNSEGKQTPLTVVPLGYANDVSDAQGWEQWFASVPFVFLDGVQQILNVTYVDTDNHNTYTAGGTSVVASGPTPVSSQIPAAYATPTGLASDIDSYLAATSDSNAGAAKTKLFNNIFTNGSIIAATSKSAPNYYYDWVRDSSLTFDVVERLYEAASGDKKNEYEQYLWAYAQSRAAQQTQPNLATGLGEPKFYINNTVFTGPWGRPQNDGPASASITFLNFANEYLKCGGSRDKVLLQLYDSANFPNAAPVKRDLLYVAEAWKQPSFDAWEEVQGDHFYNHMVQYRAAVLGSAFAQSVGDAGTAQTLQSTASAIEAWLGNFWDDKRQLILYNYNYTTLNKYSYKDIAVLLGVNHGDTGGSVYAPTDDRVLATAVQIATAFLPIYGVSSRHTNEAGATLAPAVGRYPEDVYDGVQSSRGNPWYMTTATVAEFLYRAASAFKGQSSIEVTSVSKPFWDYFAAQRAWEAGTAYSGDDKAQLLAALEGWADSFLRTVQFYTPADQTMREEFDRDSGEPVGATDLTWSYASLLSAALARAAYKGDDGYRTTLANL